MPTLRCACLVAAEAGRILLVQVRGASRWYLPGGKIEPGETCEQALVREVEEELAARLDTGSLRHLYDVVGPAYGRAGDVELVCFSGRWSGELRPSAEITALAWLGHADKHLFAPAVKILYETHFEARRPTAHR